MRSRKNPQACDQVTAIDEIAWRRDTKTPEPSLPYLVCDACMKAWVAAFAAGATGTAA